MAEKAKFRSDDQRQEAHVEEFIPFACHYDPSTLLTKNGELLQTIKIVGFTFESVNSGDSTVSLRDTIRKAVMDSIRTSDFALWFHTVRREKDLTTGGDYDEGGFADHLNKEWCKRHDWEHKYVNELYVTVIRQGQSFNLGFNEFFRSLAFKSERKFRENYLDESFQQLNLAVESIVDNLQEYGARRLTMFEKDDVTYSEPIRFFGRILNLQEEDMPVPVMDIAEYLPTHKTLFGFSAIEVKGDTGTHYGAILSVKEYHEVTASAIDEFLQLDQRFIVTETFDFINNELIQKKFEHQQYILSLSGDQEFRQISGLDDILNSNRNLPTDYGEHQISIMLIEDDLGMLKDETDRMLEALHNIGVVVVREDVMLEDCYWAQLPGNFEFLKRLSPINTMRIGGFASLYNFPAGRLDNNHWGDAVTVFYTKANTPYFFNFHDEDVGHSAIIGPYGAGKTVLLNFLVSESMKYKPKLFFFDMQRGSELFIKALSGKYKRLMKDVRSNQLKFNPLKLKDTPDNREFLKQWLYDLMMDENYELPDEDKSKLDQAIEYNFTLPEEQRKIVSLAEKFWPLKEQVVVEEPAKEEKKPNIDLLLKAAAKDYEEEEDEVVPLPATSEGRLSFWYGEGKFAHFFDNDEDELDLSTDINGFDVTEIVQERWPVIPVISYMLHRITASLDGKPTIIVLDEAWRLIDNPIFAPRITEWLEELRRKNAMVIFATESVDDASKSSITHSLIEKMATLILLPNDNATDAYKEVFNLSDKEYGMLKSMDLERRHFLLRHHGDAVVAKLNLAGMYDIMGVLSGTRENIALVESIILEVGDRPADWLPVFKEKLKK